MFRRDRWWQHEIERVRREHETREAELIATICHLSGRPLPTTTTTTAAATVRPADDDSDRFDLVFADQLP